MHLIGLQFPEFNPVPVGSNWIWLNDLKPKMPTNHNFNFRFKMMWLEARKQEKKIRCMLVDYKRRAERRKDYYEKIVSDLSGCWLV